MREPNLKNLTDEELSFIESFLLKKDRILYHHLDQKTGISCAAVTNTEMDHIYGESITTCRSLATRNVIVEIERGNSLDGITFIKYTLNPLITYKSIANPDDKNEMQVLRELDYQAEKCLE